MSIAWRERAALTIREAAEVLSVSPSHVRRHLPLVRIGGLARVRVTDVLDALGESNPKPAATVATLPANRKADRIADRIASGIRR